MLRLSVLLALLLACLAPAPALAAGDGLDGVEMERLREGLRRWDALAQVWFRLKAGDAAGAKKEVRALLRQRPGDPDALHVLGIASAATGHQAQAVSALRRSYRKRPDGWVGTHLVHLLVEMDRLGPARRTAMDLKRRLPEDRQARVAYAFVLVAVGEYKTARQELEMLEERFRDGDIAYRLSVLLREMGDKREALAAVRRAVDRSPDRPEYRRELFVTLHDAGDWQGLVDATSVRGADAVGGGLAGYYRGIALARLGRNEDAVAALASVVQHGTPDPIALAGSAGHLLQLGALEEAERAARTAVTLRSGDAALHHLLGMVLTRMGREGEAVAHYRRASELQPEDAVFRFDLLVSLCSLQRADELKAALQRAVKDFPEDARFEALGTSCPAAASS